MPRHGNSRDRLISAAMQLMRERGYEAVGVEAICQQAGLNKGSFYHYFPGKSDLALAVLESCWQEYQKTVLAPAFQPAVPPLERLGLFFSQSYRCHRQAREQSGHLCGCFFGTLGAELSSRDDKIRSRVEGIMQAIASYFEEALLEARSQGLIRVNDVTVTAQAMVACMEGMVLLAKIYNNPEVLRELAPCVFQMIGAPYPGRDSSASTLTPETVGVGMDFLD